MRSLSSRRLFQAYDAHGNMVATLARNGAGGYSVNDRRSYDAWGKVRYSQSTGDPKLRYCANLGHRADDETLLTYMRARYCDAASGRFISEDPARAEANWFAYCGNDPVNRADQSGQFSKPLFVIGLFCILTGAILIGISVKLSDQASEIMGKAFKAADAWKWLDDGRAAGADDDFLVGTFVKLASQFQPLYE